MVVSSRKGFAGLSAVSLLAVLSSIAYCSILPKSIVNTNQLDGTESGAVAGRIVSVPAKVYREAFKATIKLGQCPLVMEEGNIKTCKDEFEGEEVYLAKGATTVDVTRIQTSEDVLLHVMGGIGTSLGVLGLASVNLKVKVAVTTDTSANSLNLISSYQISKGVMTLHRPRPKYVQAGQSLFLSEIELGGNELFLVTLDFESTMEKVEVGLAMTFKVLFLSIGAKLDFVHQTFKSKASCRIQFKSSWRKELDIYFSRLEHCIPKVAEIEDMYMRGPQELRTMSKDDERSHYFYYFSSWAASPYGLQFNLALINHDLEVLTQQNTEIKAVIQRISKLKDQSWPSDVRRHMVKLNQTLTDMTNKLTIGLDAYHTLQLQERQDLFQIYGRKKAPQYYQRYLERITA